MNTKCYLCGSTNYREKHNKVRDKEDIQVYQCQECGLVFLSSFDHIDNAFYEKSKMHIEKVDPQKKIAQTANDTKRRIESLKKYLANNSVLDFGCGYGGFLLETKKIANKVTGSELDRNAIQFCVQQGICDYEKSNGELFDVITMFHSVEHLTEPLEELEKLKKRLKPGGKLIVETPNANDVLIQLYKNKAFSDFTYWSCHVILYTVETLKILLEKAGFKVIESKQIQRYSLANHLYWLSEGKPGGDKVFEAFNDEKLNQSYSNTLEALGMCDTIMLIGEK